MFRAFLRIFWPRKFMKYFKFPLKKIFEVNALKLGATSNIIDKLQKIFQKNKRLKKL